MQDPPVDQQTKLPWHLSDACPARRLVTTRKGGRLSSAHARTPRSSPAPLLSSVWVRREWSEIATPFYR